MLGDIVQGAVQFGTSFIGNKDRKARIAKGQAAYDKSLEAYFSQDTSNLYANLENTMEDLTVNTQAADFAAAQQAQGLSDVLGQTRQAAGGSGIAALAQSLANQQSQNAVAASASIGQQEAANQRAAASMAGQNQMFERQGAAQSRALKGQLLEQRATIDANELAAAEKAQQDALQQRYAGAGQALGGVTDALMMGVGGDATVFGKLGTDETRIGNFAKNYMSNLPTSN